MLLMLIVSPVLGVLWFLNLVLLLIKIKGNKSVQNQTILGAVLTFFLVLSIVFGLLGLY